MATKHLILVEDAFFIENITVFSNPDFCKVTKTIVEDDLFKDDKVWMSLISDKKKAEKKLRDYEYNVRHNYKK